MVKREPHYNLEEFLCELKFLCAPRSFRARVFCLSPIPAFADNVNFTDSTFNLANYTETAAFLSSGGDSLSFDQCSSCGNPENALQIETFILNQNETTAIGSIGNTFTINTAVHGAITSIDAS